MATLNYPTLNANITLAGQPDFGEHYKIFTRSGIKIAVLGLTTAYIPTWEAPKTIADLQLQDVLATALDYVPRLRKTADVDIVAYTGGFTRNLKTGTPTTRYTGELVGYDYTQIPDFDAHITGTQTRQLAAIVNGVPDTQPGYRGTAVH